MEEKQVEKKNRWDWLPAFMPGVVQQIAERRAKHGAAWVAECWQHGVVEGKPGWFWAAEGALAIGTPISGEMVTLFYDALARHPGSAAVHMKEPGHAAQ